MQHQRTTTTTTQHNFNMQSTATKKVMTECPHFTIEDKDGNISIPTMEPISCDKTGHWKAYLLKEILVFVIHGESSASSLEQRLENLDSYLTTARSLANEKQLMVCGDFNIPMSCEQVCSLLEKHNLFNMCPNVDTKAAGGYKSVNFQPNKFEVNQGLDVDTVLVNESLLKHITVEVGDFRGSDHKFIQVLYDEQPMVSFHNEGGNNSEHGSLNKRSTGTAFGISVPKLHAYNELGEFLAMSLGDMIKQNELSDMHKYVQVFLGLTFQFLKGETVVKTVTVTPEMSLYDLFQIFGQLRLAGAISRSGEPLATSISEDGEVSIADLADEVSGVCSKYAPLAHVAGIGSIHMPKTRYLNIAAESLSMAVQAKASYYHFIKMFAGDKKQTFHILGMYLKEIGMPTEVPKFELSTPPVLHRMVTGM